MCACGLHCASVRGRGSAWQRPNRRLCCTYLCGLLAALAALPPSLLLLVLRPKPPTPDPLEPPSRACRLASASSLLYALPTEYVARGDEPQRVLVVGWGEQAFMTQLIRVMDKAPGA